MDIIGNQKTAKLLERIVGSGFFANAYLFVGPRDIGKTKAALSFAKKIIHNEKKIDANLIIIEPEVEEKNGIIKKKNIKIEVIRELQHKLSLTSFSGEYKAVIINEAERLGVASQNALLKTLEEPNEKVVLILVAQDEKKILSTIVSRCQKIRMGLTDNRELAKNISSELVNKEELLFWSVGKSELLHSFLKDSELLEIRREVKNNLLSIVSGAAIEKMNLAEKWSKDISELAVRMEIWIIFLRQVMLGKQAMKEISPAKALMLIEDITKELKNIQETNANARLVLENLFLKI